MSVNVILVSRSNPNLEEVTSLQKKFPNKKIHFIRTEPKDFSEHIELCEKHKADLVLLPPAIFFLSKKLEAHHPSHVGLGNDQELRLVVGIAPPVSAPFLVHNS